MKKTKIITILTIFMLLSFVVILSACGLFGKKQDDITLPTKVSIRAEKTNSNYLKSSEYIFNSETNCSMCLDDGESYYIIVTYDNPSNLSISSVSISGVKYTADKFVEEKSTKQETYLLFKVEEAAETRKIQYTLGTVQYVKGTETKSMQWTKEGDRVDTVEVSIRPQFTLKLDYQNKDNRIASISSGNSVNQTSDATVFYNADLSANVVSPDFDGKSKVSLPQKAGGWLFAGWYTKPRGEGYLVTAEEKYYFWRDITLYAHYVRMYDLEKVELKSGEEIVHTYQTTTGTQENTTFKSGVIVKNKGFNDFPETHYPTLTLPDTIVDDVIQYETTIDPVTLIPQYTVKVTTSEYPLIKIDDSAFDSFNTITTISEFGKYISEIGYRAFYDCTKIATLNFNANSKLKYIGDYAFEKTTLLGANTHFTLPNSVEYLGNFAFRDSGWRFSRNGAQTGGGEPKLLVKKNWKFIGYKCFFGTQFSSIVFEPGCYFSGQIDIDEGSALESAGGYKTFHKDENLIGASTFAKLAKLETVEFQKSSDEIEDALNLIPDACFDIFSWENNSSLIRNLTFNEGLKYIGRRAFYYQKKVPLLELPVTLEEVDVEAFYHNISVEKLTFGGISNKNPDDSRLRILHSNCFGNLRLVDSVSIGSIYFSKYGSGIFRGCDRLKCVIFENLSKAPIGFSAGENMRGNTDLEVVPYHFQSDFLYATGEVGDTGATGADEKSTYSSPLRVFCQGGLVDSFKEELKRGKQLTASGQSTGGSAFNTSVFVHNKNHLITYVNEVGGESEEVTIAYQEIYRATDLSGSKPIGYSLVYWGARSKKIRLPIANDLGLSQDTYAEITEIAMYALPTCVEYVYIPSSYKKIEHDAFNACSSLTEVEFEDLNALEYIGDYAFFGTSLSSFKGGENLKVIANNAFRNCKALEYVDLSDTSIVSAYNGSTKLITQYKYDYELNDKSNTNLKPGYDWGNVLGDSAFQGCSNLVWIYLPENIQQIRNAMFTGCSSLVHVIIPTASINDSMPATNDEAFYQYAPAATYNANTMFKLILYVSGSAEATHRKIFPITDRRSEVDQSLISGYAMVDSIPDFIKEIVR